MNHQIFFRNRVHTAAAGLLCTLWTLGALAAPPAAPVVATSADIKQLHFDWSIVPRSNYYEFWFKANTGAPWVKFSEPPPWQPTATNNISAHLLDWDQARYQVKACNFSGCTPSPAIPVKDRMFESIGYLKASGSYRDGRFGFTAAISEDGQTIAAFAGNEPVSGGNIASVYVFRRINGVWQQQKRIVPSTTNPDVHNIGLEYFGKGTLALSGDGNRLMISLPVCPTPGAVCNQLLSVWLRNGSTWTREYQQLDFDMFLSPWTVDMDEAGDRIVYRSSLLHPLRVLERTTAGWVNGAPVPADPSDLTCSMNRLSGDGATLARLCSPHTSSIIHLLIAKAPDWNVTRNLVLDWPRGQTYGDFAIDHAGTTVAYSTSIEVDILDDPRQEVHVVKLANGTFSETKVRAGSWAPAEYGRFGGTIALSRDGAYLAAYDRLDHGEGRGVLSPPLTAGALATGAVSVFEVRDTGPRLRRVLKPNGPLRARNVNSTLAFANNGKTLLVSDPEDASNATGIDGDRTDTTMPGAGALWLY